MSAADSLKKVLESFSQARAKVMEAHGGKPPRELMQQFQVMQDKLTGGMEQVQQLSDKMEEAKAKAAADSQAWAAGQEEKKEERIDFEAYPWQFEKEHGLGPEPRRELVQSLLATVGEPRQPPAPPPPAKLPALPLPAAPHDIPELHSYPSEDPPDFETLGPPD